MEGIWILSVENFLSNSTKNFLWGTLLCFRKFRVSKNLMPKRGKSRFSIEKLLSHSAEKHRRGTILCFTKILVSKKIMDKRRGGGRWREYQCSPSKFLCLAVPKKKFRRAIFSSFNNSGYRKILDRRLAGGEYQEFSSKISCFTVKKTFVEEPFCVSKSFGYQKNLEIRGGYHVFLSEIFCLTVPKNSEGEPFCVSEKF